MSTLEAENAAFIRALTHSKLSELSLVRLLVLLRKLNIDIKRPRLTPVIIATYVACHTISKSRS